MIQVSFLKNDKIILQQLFETLAEAEEFVFEEPHDFSFKYQIFDLDKDEMLDEGELESNDDIVG